MCVPVCGGPSFCEVTEATGESSQRREGRGGGVECSRTRTRGWEGTVCGGMTWTEGGRGPFFGCGTCPSGPGARCKNTEAGLRVPGSESGALPTDDVNTARPVHLRRHVCTWGERADACVQGLSPGAKAQ